MRHQLVVSCVQVGQRSFQLSSVAEESLMFGTELRNLSISLPMSLHYVLSELRVEVKINLSLNFSFIQSTLQTVNGGVVRHQRTLGIVSGRCLHLDFGSEDRHVRQKMRGFKVRAIRNRMKRRVSSGIGYCGRRNPNLANKPIEWVFSGVDLLKNDGTISWKVFLHPAPNIFDQKVTNSNRGITTRRSHD